MNQNSFFFGCICSVIFGCLVFMLASLLKDTSHLQQLKAGDVVVIGNKAYSCKVFWEKP